MENLSNIKELSTSDISAVSAGVGIPGAVVGGILGGASYLGNAAVSGSSVSGFLGAVGLGGLTGFVTGGAVSVTRTYLATRISLVGGVASGGVGGGGTAGGDSATRIHVK